MAPVKEFVIKLRGLPFSATAEEIVEFFQDVEIAGGSEGVFLPIGIDGRPTGEGYVELASQDWIPEAEKKNNKHMGKRYIEVSRVRKSEMEWFMKRSSMEENGPKNHDLVVRLRGIPFECNKGDITKFFEGIAVCPNGIVMPLNGQGRSLGEAFVQLVNKRAHQMALEKNKEKIGHRYIEIYQSSIKEFRGAIAPLMASCESGGRGGGPGPRRGFGERPSPYGGGRGRGQFVGGRGGYDAGPSGRWAEGGGGPPSIGGMGSTMGGHIVNARGLPFSATEQDIAAFFKPLNPIKIHIIYEDERPSGKAEVEFATHGDALEAMKKDKENMQSRYVELFLKSMSKSSMGGRGGGAIPAGRGGGAMGGRGGGPIPASRGAGAMRGRGGGPIPAGRGGAAYNYNKGYGDDGRFEKEVMEIRDLRGSGGAGYDYSKGYGDDGRYEKEAAMEMHDRRGGSGYDYSKGYGDDERYEKEAAMEMHDPRGGGGYDYSKGYGDDGRYEKEAAMEIYDRRGGGGYDYNKGYGDDGRYEKEAAMEIHDRSGGGGGYDYNKGYRDDVGYEKEAMEIRDRRAGGGGYDFYEGYGDVTRYEREVMEIRGRRVGGVGYDYGENYDHSGRHGNGGGYGNFDEGYGRRPIPDRLGGGGYDYREGTGDDRRYDTGEEYGRRPISDRIGGGGAGYDSNKGTGDDRGYDIGGYARRPISDRLGGGGGDIRDRLGGGGSDIRDRLDGGGGDIHNRLGGGD